MHSPPREAGPPVPRRHQHKLGWTQGCPSKIPARAHRCQAPIEGVAGDRRVVILSDAATQQRRGPSCISCGLRRLQHPRAEVPASPARTVRALFFAPQSLRTECPSLVLTIGEARAQRAEEVQAQMRRHVGSRRKPTLGRWTAIRVLTPSGISRGTVTEKPQ
jgi:hypothetical protein